MNVHDRVRGHVIQKPLMHILLRLVTSPNGKNGEPHETKCANMIKCVMHPLSGAQKGLEE